LTKQGFVFAFDRVTGKPLWPIEERPVPQSKVPGERTSPTQPFPTRPAPIMPQGYSEDRLIDFTPELRAEAVEIMKHWEKGPLFTPPVVADANIKGTFVYPGFGGGANWNGAAVDPQTGVMYIPIRHRPSGVGLAKGDPARTNMAYVQVNNQTVDGPRGLPILKPPYSELVALDMNKGEQLWRVPNGGAPDSVRNNPALKGLKLDFDHMGQVDIRPGPLLTDLLFMGESGTISASRGGSAFRAYDKKTGKTIWSMPLPTLSTGAPMTYVHKGRQYIVIAVAAPGKPAELIALTLDGASENGPAPAAGVPVSQAPVSATAAAGAITATAAELATGKAAYDRACALCHAPDGAGGIGPRLTGRSDFANISRVIAQGQGEMPSLANSLTPAEIDAIAKHVVKVFGAPRSAPVRPARPED
jgi:quinoprotein glucose dehydrogenase